MGKKLHADPEVQALLNGVMPWVKAQLRDAGEHSAAVAWIPSAAAEPHMLASDLPKLSVEEQEQLLAQDLRVRWQRGELEAAALVAPIFYGRAGSGERSLAVRLHIETRAGFCADILMPYRIRPASRWRGNAKNRVHFSQPVAQESDSLLGAPGQGIIQEASARD